MRPFLDIVQRGHSPDIRRGAGFSLQILSSKIAFSQKSTETAGTSLVQPATGQETP